MTQEKSDFLAKAINVAFRYARAYDDCCPDVGMGPSDDMILDHVLVEIGVSLADLKAMGISEAQIKKSPRKR